LGCEGREGGRKGGNWEIRAGGREFGEKKRVERSGTEIYVEDDRKWQI